MAKTIIKRKTTGNGTIELSYIRKEDGYTGTICFNSEAQLKAFASFLKQMILFNSASVEIK